MKMQKNEIEREELPIKGCMKMHLISVDMHGNWKTRTVFDRNETDDVINIEENDVEDEVYDELDDLMDSEEIINGKTEDIMNAKFDFIETDTYVTLQTPKQSIENFYLFKVKGKHVATEYVKDSQGHVIAKGEPYFLGIMYE